MSQAKPPNINLRRLRPLELTQLVNSSPLGQVVDERHLRTIRAKAGTRIGDGRTVDLLRFLGWLCQSRHFGDVQAAPGESTGRVLTNMVQLSNHYGVTVRVIRDQWLAANDFPGKSGKGKRPGYFPLDEINRWLLQREANRKGGNPSKAAFVAAKESGLEIPKEPSAREKLSQVELELATIKLRKESAQYLDKDKTIQVVVKQHTIAVQKLKSLPFKLLSILPPETPPVLKASFFQQAETAIKEACESISSEYMSGVLE